MVSHYNVIVLVFSYRAAIKELIPQLELIDGVRNFYLILIISLSLP